ncbi:MAG: hypothetical protein ABIO70_32415 [Pseudomonadota bacterium]
MTQTASVSPAAMVSSMTAVQWAAVTSHSGDTRNPEQSMVPSSLRSPCCNHSSTTAG